MTLVEKYQTAVDQGYLSNNFSDVHAFFYGAAAMAELFAAGSGPLLEELRGIREALQSQKLCAFGCKPAFNQFISECPVHGNRK